MIVFLWLIAVVMADGTITENCNTCGTNTACYSLTGMDFQGKIIRVPGTCSSLASYSFPNTITFTCDAAECSDGCRITSTQVAGSNCSNSNTGRLIIANLNILYSYEQGDITLSQTYDWCNCGLSTLAIVGIVVGSVIGAILIIALICYLCRRCEKKSG